MAFGLFLTAEAITFIAARLVESSVHTGRFNGMPPPLFLGIVNVVNKIPLNILPTRSWIYTGRTASGSIWGMYTVFTVWSINSR